MLSSLLSGVVQAGAIMFRDSYNGHPVWNNTRECVAQYTNNSAIIDRTGFFGYSAVDGDYTIWLDVGDNVTHDVDEDLASRINLCVQKNYNETTVKVRSHNDYAVGGSYDSDDELYQHYDFFGHGLPEDFDPDAPESIYCGDEAGSVYYSGDEAEPV